MTLRCLLVDDSEDFLAAATRLLESQGLEIVGSATTAEEAVELAASLKPDLALVDIELGDQDGVALSRELEREPALTRVVLISSYEYDDLEDLVQSSSAAGFLSKSALGADAIVALLPA
jgi:two-component system, NarL family, nitrate/nitrite response regulator NarL